MMDRLLSVVVLLMVLIELKVVVMYSVIAFLVWRTLHTQGQVGYANQVPHGPGQVGLAQGHSYPGFHPLGVAASPRLERPDRVLWTQADGQSHDQGNHRATWRASIRRPLQEVT